MSKFLVSLELLAILAILPILNVGIMGLMSLLGLMHIGASIKREHYDVKSQFKRVKSTKSFPCFRAST